MSVAPPPAQQPPVPNVLYGTMTGLVDADMVKRVFAGGQILVNNGSRRCTS